MRHWRSRAYWVALILVLLAAEVSVLLLWRATRAEDGIFDHDFRDVSRVNDLVLAIERSEDKARSFLMTGSPEYLEGRKAEFQRAAVIVEELKQTLPREELDLLNRIESEGERLVEASRFPIQLRLEGASDTRVKDATQVLITLRDSLDTSLGELLQDVRLRLLGRLVGVRSDRTSAFLLMAGAVFLAIAVLASWLYLMRRTLGTLERQRQRLEEQAALHGQVMGIVSHNLRSPLTAVITTAETGLLTVTDPELRARDRRVLRSARRMERVTELLMDLARVAGVGGLVLLPDRIDVEDLVHDVARDYREAHPSVDLEVDWTGLTRFVVDGERLEQVLEAMLDDLLRTDGNVSVRMEGGIAAEGLTIRVRKAEEGGKGRPMESRPVEVGEDLYMLVAEKVVAGQGGQLRRHENEIHLHLPAGARFTQLGAPPPS